MQPLLDQGAHSPEAGSIISGRLFAGSLGIVSDDGSCFDQGHTPPGGEGDIGVGIPHAVIGQ